MAPSRYKNIVPSRRKPLSDASSKANALASNSKTLPADKRQSADVQDIRQVAKSHLAYPRASIKPVQLRSLAPPATTQQHMTSRLSASHNRTFKPLRTHIGPWQLGEVVGKGASSHVRKVRHEDSGVIGVAKIIDKVTAEKVRARSLANLGQRMAAGDFHFAAQLALPVNLEREIVIMRLLQHPNIVRLFDVWETDNEIFLIMENIEGGELYRYMSEVGLMKEVDAIQLFRQLVEALLYCHRMQIFHRDLKPENILIDQDCKTIKLIDFGMAAYQPSGDLLKTPCGSPHYAAPELLDGRAYDGSKVDVWSLVVVLFVMLTNDQPFNIDPNTNDDQKMASLYRNIKMCRYRLPTFLSIEAKDLFRKAFVKDPAHRISIVELWNHPLLHKYDKEHGWIGRTLRQAVGHTPETLNWLPLSPGLVDREIFRNLRTLWHDVDEKVLLMNLCNAAMNPEKHFYAALIQYREQCLNSRQHAAVRRGRSTADSEHLNVVDKLTAKERLAKSQGGSQFSVFQAEHLKSRHSFFEDGPTDISYDPFRAVSANRNTIAEGYTNAQSLAQARHIRSVASARRHSTRVETLKGHASSFKSAREGSSDGLSVASRPSKTHSRHSTNSSPWIGNRSSIVIAKTSTRHRRNVSFDHRLRRSVPYGSTTALDESFTQASFPEVYSPSQLVEISSSPPILLNGVHTLVQPKSVASVIPLSATPRMRHKKDIERAARKVSTELGEACHKAFFRSSTSDISTRSVPSDQVGTDTPPTSLFSRAAHSTPKEGHGERILLDRPLPPTPDTAAYWDVQEKFHAYTKHELSEMRKQLSQRCGKDGADNTAYYREIISQLDSLMKDRSAETSMVGYSSEHAGLSEDDTSLLQPIPEEGRFTNSDELLGLGYGPNLAGRASKAFDGSMKPPRYYQDIRTIRLVAPSSPPETPTPLAPLKIRKSRAPTPFDHPTLEESPVSPDLQEDTAEHQKQLKDNPKETTKLPWWRRVSSNTASKEHDSKRTPSTGSEWEDLDDRVSRRDERAAESTQFASHMPVTPKRRQLGIASGDLPDGRYYRPHRSTAIGSPTKTSNYVLPQNKSKGSRNDRSKAFLKGLFRKRGKAVYDVGDNSSQISGDDALHENGTPKAIGKSERMREHGERNLLDRLLRFKPESKVLVMSHPRRMSRVILHRVLLQESSAGIVDVAPDGENRNTFVARLAHDNKWGLKAVSFVIEFFSILRDGKQAQLTAVRFTQTQGSAASLRRLVHLLCQHLENSHLHADAKETKEIGKMIQTGRLSNGE